MTYDWERDRVSIYIANGTLQVTLFTSELSGEKVYYSSSGSSSKDRCLCIATTLDGDRPQEKNIIDDNNCTFNIIHRL